MIDFFNDVLSQYVFDETVDYVRFIESPDGTDFTVEITYKDGSVGVIYQTSGGSWTYGSDDGQRGEIQGYSHACGYMD